MNYTIHLTDTPDDATRLAILEPLAQFNRIASGQDGPRLLVLELKDEQGDVVGGLWGHTSYEWLFVALLFVPESMRRQGIGRELLRQAEREAATRACHGAWLDTFQFQAPGFYKALGYSTFGELSDYPSGSCRVFLSKRLAPPPPFR